MYKTIKVFDCQDMPETTKNEFFDSWDNGKYGNDCIVEWFDDEDESPVTKWLLSNGAERNETVLIKHWW